MMGIRSQGEADISSGRKENAVEEVFQSGERGSRAKQEDDAGCGRPRAASGRSYPMGRT